MSPIWHSLVVSAALLGQTSAGDADIARERQIRAAVWRLAAQDYATREQAYRELWRQGSAAEPALRRAAKSSDGETRLRAKRLLRDLEYGILPGTDAATQQLIRKFRDGGTLTRQAAFQRLVQRERIEILERLIRLESDPQVRRQWLAQMFQNTRIVDRFVQRDRIDELIENVGAGQDDAWKRSVTIQLMFAPNVLSRLAETGSLGKLLQLVRDEADAQVRQSMLVAIFNSAGIGAVLAQNQLDFVLETLRAEPDQKLRGSLLSGMVSNAQAAQAIVRHQQLDAILTFSREQTDEASQQQLLERILASGPIVESLLKEGGVERVIALVSKETDPVRRGRLLGTTISSSAVRTFLQRNGLSEFAVRLAKEESNEAARHEFLQALLHDTSFIYSLNNETTIGELWQLIKADANAAWRAQALIVLLQSHRSNALLKDKEEAAWILDLAGDDASGPVREDILRFLLPNVQAQRVLIADGHFETMLALARNLPIRSRGEILANFLAGAGVAEHLVATKRIELLLTISQEEPDANVRQLCLQSVFRNSIAMTALLEAGHYETFRDLIQHDDDPARRANLFGAFIQNYRVMEHLTKQGDSRLLLEYAETEDEAARRQFLPRLFQNHRAVTLLMDQGHFERLVTLARQDGGTNFDELLAVPKVIEHLAATKRFDLFFDFATTEADDNTRRNLLRTVFVNPKAIEALIASENLDRLLGLIQAERDATWRASLLGPVISSPPVVTHFAKAKRLAVLLALVSREPEPVVRTRLMTYLINREDVLNIFIERGNLDALIALANLHTSGQARGDILARLVTNTKALEQLRTEHRVGLLLSFTDDADGAFTTAYVSRLFMVSKATDVLVEAGYYRDVFKIAISDGTPQVRAALIGRLLNSPKAVEQLVTRNDVATLVAIIKSEPDEASRRNYLATVCGNERLIDAMLKGELFDALVETIRAEPDPTARQRQLAMLVYSEQAMARLVATEQLEAIISGAIAESDSNIRGQWLGNVMRTPARFTALVKLSYGERLLDAAEKGIPVSTQQSLVSSVFSNQQAMELLIEQGHFERLLTAAKRHGGSQLDSFLRSPTVIEHCSETKQLDVILQCIARELDPNAKGNVLYALVRSQKALQALLDAGQFASFCESLQGVPDANWRASILTMAFGSGNVVQHYLKTKQLDRFAALIEQPSLANARSQILARAFGRSDVVALVIEQGQFDAVLRIIKQHTSGDTKGQLLAQLLTSTDGFAKLAEADKVDSLVKYAIESESSVSSAFASRLFMYQNIVGELIERGHFADLYKLATLETDATTGTRLLGRLLLQSRAIQQLSASGQLAVVVEYAQGEMAADARRAYLTQVCSNSQLVDELIRAQLFDRLAKVCQDEPEVEWRRRHFAALLYSERAIDKFASAERLEPLLTEVLAEPDKRVLQSWLSRVFAQSNVAAALMRHGFAERLMAAAEQHLEPTQRQNVYRALVSNSAIVTQVVRAGQYQVLLKILADETPANGFSYGLQAITANEEALRVITSAGDLNQLLERVAAVTNDSARENFQRQTLTSHGTISAFAQQGKLPMYFELLRGDEKAKLRQSCLESLVYQVNNRRLLADLSKPEPLVELISGVEESRRHSLVSRLVSDSHLRRRWIEADQRAALEDLIALSPLEQNRTKYRQALYYTPSGVLGHLLRENEFGEAETLLAERGDELTMSWLAAYHTSRDQLEVEIDRLRRTDAATRTDVETRLLSYLLRASGDLSGASEVATSLGDPRLLRPLLVEQRKWSDAAALQEQSPLPPPAFSVSQDEATQRIEQLGMLASYHRLAGEEEAFNDTVEQILALAESNQRNPQLVWHAAEALLLNDRVDEGLRLVQDSQPIKAFHLFLHRHDYDAAFKMVDCGERFVANREWFDGLVSGTASAQAQRRFNLAIEVAGVLRTVGRQEAAESIFTVCEAVIRETPERGQWPSKSQVAQWYSGGLYRLGLKDRAWRAATEAIDPRYTSPPNVLSDIFGQRAGEARVWWSLFRHQDSSEKAELRLGRIDAVLNPASAEAVASFPDLARQTLDFGATGQNETFWRGLADACVARSQHELAIECYERIAGKTLDATIAHADVLFSTGRWAEAADAYHGAWQQDVDRLALLFVAGVARQRAGEEVEGKAWQRLADLQAVPPKARYQLALALNQRGLVEAANRQWDVLLRTAPFESFELNDAARRLAMNAYAHEPDAAAPLWQHYLLGDVRPAFWFLNDASYLSVPAQLHKIRAIGAVKRSDFEMAQVAMQLALKLSPGNTKLVEDVVPLLDAAGQSKIADPFVSQVVTHYEKLCHAHPQSAYLHNNLAWAAARCHRELEMALLHAEKAVELAPNNAGYLDTLAEVYFQRGDRDNAVRWSERSVALRPLGKGLQEQLARFRSAPLPTP